MDSSRFRDDIENNGTIMTDAQTSKDGRKKVLVVGAGAAG